MSNQKELNKMIGLTVKSVSGLENNSEKVTIVTDCDRVFIFDHSQDSCEDASLKDFEGGDFEGGLIISAEEIEGGQDVEGYDYLYMESYTWTFYKIETSKGGLFMRWLGESNGCYSEEVDVYEKLNK